MREIGEVIDEGIRNSYALRILGWEPMGQNYPSRGGETLFTRKSGWNLASNESS